MATKLYAAEVGVLLKPTHKEFADYATCFGKKHAYYNETTAVFLTEKERDEWAQNYVKEGNNHTYAVLLKPADLDVDEDDINDIKSCGWCDNIDMEDFGFGIENIERSFVKFDDTIIENFHEKELPW